MQIFSVIKCKENKYIQFSQRLSACHYNNKKNPGGNNIEKQIACIIN